MHDVAITVRMPQGLQEALVDRARHERYSLSDEVRRALWRHVERDLNDDGTLAGAPIVPTAAFQEPQDVKD